MELEQRSNDSEKGYRESIARLREYRIACKILLIAYLFSLAADFIVYILLLIIVSNIISYVEVNRVFFNIPIIGPVEYWKKIYYSPAGGAAIVTMLLLFGVSNLFLAVIGFYVPSRAKPLNLMWIIWLIRAAYYFLFAALLYNISHLLGVAIAIKSSTIGFVPDAPIVQAMERLNRLKLYATISSVLGIAEGYIIYRGGQVLESYKLKIGGIVGALGSIALAFLKDSSSSSASIVGSIATALVIWGLRDISKNVELGEWRRRIEKCEAWAIAGVVAIIVVFAALTPYISASSKTADAIVKLEAINVYREARITLDNIKIKIYVAAAPPLCEKAGGEIVCKLKNGTIPVTIEAEAPLGRYSKTIEANNVKMELGGEAKVTETVNCIVIEARKVTVTKIEKSVKITVKR